MKYTVCALCIAQGPVSGICIAVPQDLVCPFETACAAEVLQGGKRAASDFSRDINDPL